MDPSLVAAPFLPKLPIPLHSTRKFDKGFDAQHSRVPDAATCAMLRLSNLG